MGKATLHLFPHSTEATTRTAVETHTPQTQPQDLVSAHLESLGAPADLLEAQESCFGQKY